MIRALRALAWMRFRLFVNGMMRTGRRDTLEQISRAVASVLPVVLTITLVPSAIALAVGGFFAGRYLADGGEHSPLLITGVRLGLFVLTLMVGLLPVVRSAGGKESGLTRLLLLPIPRRVLLLSEVTAGFGDPWLGLAVPLLLAVPVGLAAGGAAASASTLFASTVLLLLTLAALNACSSLGLTLLFRDRRRGEWATVAFVCVFSIVFVVPLAFPDAGDWLEDSSRTGSPESAPTTLEQRFQRFVPGPARVFPGEVYAAALKSSISGGSRRGWLPLAGLVGWCGGLILLAGSIHRRLLESPTGGARRKAGRKSELSVKRYPGLTRGASAVARATARSALRTVRGRIAVYLNCVIVGVLLLLSQTQAELQLPAGSQIGLGQLGTLGGIVMSLIALQPVTLNVFAGDHAGLTLQFLAPVTRREIVLGKMAAGAALIGVSTALCTAISIAVSTKGSAAIWLALFLAYVSANLILGPLTALLSAVFPKHADLSRMGKAGNPHNMAGLLGFLLVPLALAPPLGLAALALFGLDSTLLALLLPGLWTLLAALLFVPLSRIAVAALTRRAENLLLVAVGR